MPTSFPISIPHAPTGFVDQAALDAAFTTPINDLAAQALVTASGITNVVIATGGTPVSVTVTFPVGLFSAAPRVVTSVVTTTPQNRSSAASSITAANCIVTGYSTTSGTIAVHWIATAA